MPGRPGADLRSMVRFSACALTVVCLLAAAPAGAAPVVPATAPDVSMYRFPVPDGQLFVEERTDRGQDFATRPGAPVLAVGRALVMTNRGYFPGRTVVLKLLDGPFAGRFVFYGHARRALVRPGQVVRGGQPVSIAGGVGAPGNPGHMEVGFALSEDGIIPTSASCDHYTRSGGEMHALMRQLNPELVGPRPIRSPRCPVKKPAPKPR
jgi:murein DD-endopeptidase MepM/ murein hydrolase activator NlpD